MDEGCKHVWVPSKIVPAHPVSVNTQTIYMSQVSYYQVTEVVCVECMEVRVVGQDPNVAMWRKMQSYAKQ